MYLVQYLLRSRSGHECQIAVGTSNYRWSSNQGESSPYIHLLSEGDPYLGKIDQNFSNYLLFSGFEKRLVVQLDIGIHDKS